MAWSDLPLEPDDECVEIGCAPGGASQALLERGLFVTGIDPADVDPVVWVERIPVSETRTYVKRVLGNSLVYRTQLGGEPLSMIEALRSIR